MVFNFMCICLGMLLAVLIFSIILSIHMYQSSKINKLFCNIIVQKTPVDWCYADTNLGSDKMKLIYLINNKVLELKFLPHWTADKVAFEMNRQLFS